MVIILKNSNCFFQQNSQNHCSVCKDGKFHYVSSKMNSIHPNLAALVLEHFYSNICTFSLVTSSRFSPQCNANEMSNCSSRTDTLLLTLG